MGAIYIYDAYYSASEHQDERVRKDKRALLMTSTSCEQGKQACTACVEGMAKQGGKN